MQVEIIVADSLPPHFNRVSTVIGKDINTYQDDFAHRERIVEESSQNVQYLQQKLTEKEEAINRMRAEV